MKPDSKQIIHSSCWRSMLDDIFLCIHIAEGVKWSTKVFSFSWIKGKVNPERGSVGIFTSILVSKVWKETWPLFAWLVFIRYLVFSVSPKEFQQLGQNKSASFPSPAQKFSLITGGVDLFCLFSLTLQSLPRAVGWDVLMTRPIWKFLQNLNVIFFNTHSGLKLFTCCKQEGICRTELCRPAKYGLVLEQFFPKSLLAFGGEYIGNA